MEDKIYILEHETGQRLDRVLSDRLEELSRTRIQNLIKSGFILVNDKPCKVKYPVNLHDMISISIPPDREANILPEDIPLDILYEDSDLLVVNKPKDMVVHPAVGHYTGTLVNAIMFHCQDQLSGINGVLRPGIVHRIDRNTTGALVICKNDFSHKNIARQLKQHTIRRRYLAITDGVIQEDEGTIHAPIGRHPIDRLKMSINSKNGKDAITHYRVLQRFDHHTFIECVLETGRTHQIRVHLSSLGYPLLGDDLYNSNKCVYHLQGQTLHAQILGFIHPRTGEYVEFQASLPQYFEKLLNKL